MKRIGWVEVMLDKATREAISAGRVFHEKPEIVSPGCVLASLMVDEVSAQVDAPYIAQATAGELLEHLREYGNNHPHPCHLGHAACASSMGGWCMCVVRAGAESHPEFDNVVVELRRARRMATDHTRST